MNNEKELEEIIKKYIYDYSVEHYSYKMMGKMLDKDYVKSRAELFDLHNIFIYGGGYLGIQLYNAFGGDIVVDAFVDSSCFLSVNLDVDVINLETLKERYSGQKIIITPIRYYDEISKNLESFINKSNIIYLGEFLEGVR